MTKDRLQTLQELVAQDAKNAFARYALAQEYARLGRLEEAVVEFRRITEVNADYTAAYFHGGKTLEKLGRAAEAREMYQRGVAACTRAGSPHALSEMQAALDELG